MTFRHVERPMLRLGVAAAVALAVAVAVAAALPAWVSYPPFCSSVTNVGNFCISYDPMRGRYNAPPPGVPADYGTFATQTAQREVTAPTTEARMWAAAISFAITLAIGWALAGAPIPALRRRATTRDIQ